MNKKRTVAVFIGVIVILWGALFQSPQVEAATLRQLNQIVRELIAVSGYDLSVDLSVNRRKSGGVAGIIYSGKNGAIYVDPNKMRLLETNTWAFILGHELSHLILAGESGELNNDEFTSDGLGALMAKQAGYNLRSYIIWIYNNPNTCSLTHGCFHRRARELENFYGVNTGYYSKDHAEHKTSRGLPGGNSCR